MNQLLLKSLDIDVNMVGRNDDIYRNITRIAKKYGIFDCIPCSRKIKAYLIARNIRGKQIIVKTGSQDPLYGRIYDDSIGELISTTGYHEGIVLVIDGEETVFDNCHPNGISKTLWLQNLDSPILEIDRAFQIEEIEF
ncbi:papain fold toxin domain-containing protein [Pannus brasiliensis CCIBt3594]|uniref:Papain fold toxin domain-containing protein n=1 Tax=Pannus brasiliensis CCIBt3594 TaxID=1427578 RepID=A0AAW9QTL3_9CHRO